MSVKLAVLLAKRQNLICYMKRSNMRTSPDCPTSLGMNHKACSQGKLFSMFEGGETVNNKLLNAGDTSSKSIHHQRVDIRRHTSNGTYDILGRHQKFFRKENLGSIRSFSSTANAESLDDSLTDTTCREKENDVKGNGGSKQLNRRKTYYRAKQLCSILKKKQEAIYKEFTLKHRKRFYTLQNGVFYEFQSSKEIIIDEDAILKSKNERNKTLLKISNKEVKRVAFSNKNIERTPVIVILGHFNHGKTTLLDALGSFTIEIRTCYVPLVAESKKVSVTIIDTPGQDIFYRMRNYGVSVADMVLLVVSLEDGVCSQTEESIGAVETIINNYKAMQGEGEGQGEGQGERQRSIPIIVCLNKMDSKLIEDPGNRILEVQAELEQYTILENAIFIPISAKIGTNLDILKKNIIDVVQDYQEKEKIRIIEVEKDKEKERIRILLQKRLDIEKERERKKLGGLCMAIDTVKDDSMWNDSVDDNFNHSSSSNGVLLDIIKSRKLGTTLHVVIKEGQVQEGDYFASGGWSGKIKRISHENGDSEVTNRTFENGRIPIAKCGWGVRLNVTMNKLCDEPNPLGDEILFYSSDGTESYKKVAEASRANARSGSTCSDKVIPERSSEVGSENGSENGSEKSINRSGVTGFESTSTSDTSVKSDTVVTGSAAVGDSEGEGEVLSVRQHLKFFQAYEEEADNLANDYADRLRMSHNIESYAMTDEAADRIRLPQKWYIIKIRNNKRKSAWEKQESSINNPTFYDENGTRIKFDEDYDGEDGEREGGEGEEGDDDDDLECIHDDCEDDDNNGEGERDRDGEKDEMTEEDYERKMAEKNEAFLEEKNARIQENNKREEDDMMRKQFNKKKGRNVLVRTLSDVYLSTIMDCLESEEKVEEENYEVFSKESVANKKKIVVKEEVQPLSVINASIGEITSKDIMIASSSNATIITYLLPLNSDSQRLAQEQGVRVVAFDKFEDIINIIKLGLHNELRDMAKLNQKPPQKKKNKK